MWFELVIELAVARMENTRERASCSRGQRAGCSNRFCPVEAPVLARHVKSLVFLT
jgi:hypothetical protein